MKVLKIRLQELKDKANARPAGYYDDIVSQGKIEGNALIISPQVYLNLLKKYDPTAVPPIPKAGCCGSPRNTIPINKPQALQMPPLLTQVKNAGGAAARVASNFIQGYAIKASAEVIETRKSICDGCEFLDKTKGRCSKCGCWYQTKITLASEACPIGKWAKV